MTTCPDNANPIHFYGDPTNEDAFLALTYDALILLAKRMEEEGLQRVLPLYGRILSRLDEVREG